jgi:hypothetical protein
MAVIPLVQSWFSTACRMIESNERVGAILAMDHTLQAIGQTPFSGYRTLRHYCLYDTAWDSKVKRLHPIGIYPIEVHLLKTTSIPWAFYLS